MPSQRPPNNAIDKHPQRIKIIDALMSGESPDSVAKWVKPYISKVSLWRYKKLKIKPALQRLPVTAKVLRETGLTDENGQPTKIAEEALSVTRQSLIDEPIISRLAAKYRRFDKAFESNVIDANLENAETRALQFDAQLRQVGGFGQQPQAAVTNNYALIMLPKPEPIQAQNVEFRQLPEAPKSEE